MITLCIWFLIDLYIQTTILVCNPPYKHFGSVDYFSVGAWVPVSQLAEEEVTAFRQLEEDRIGRVLDDLLEICKSQKVGTSSPLIVALCFF